MSIPSQAWLLIAHGGGRWSVADVRQKLCEEDRVSVTKAIGTLADSGCLTVYDKSGEHSHQRYGVTLDCRVPTGITAWEAVEALGMFLKQDVDENTSAKGLKVRELLRTMAVAKEAA